MELIFIVCRTPLHLALSHANRKVFDLILESPTSIDLDSKNSEGHPPLWLALRSFEGTDDSLSNPFSDEPSVGSKVFEEMAESLVAKGASVNIVSAQRYLKDPIKNVLTQLRCLTKGPQTPLTST